MGKRIVKAHYYSFVAMKKPEAIIKRYTINSWPGSWAADGS